MKKKDLKKLIISGNGKILNWRKFQYRGIIYYFNYFIKDWNQSSNFFFKHKIKSDYIKQTKIFEEKGIIKTKDKGQFYLSFINFVFYASVSPFPFFIASFFFALILLLIAIACPPLYWISASKIEYEDLEIRIKELRKWKTVCPDKHFNYFPYTKKEKLKWAFENFIMHNYALKNKNKIVITFKNYQEMKDRWNE